jgi:hypothetical protein
VVSQVSLLLQLPPAGGAAAAAAAALTARAARAATAVASSATAAAVPSPASAAAPAAASGGEASDEARYGDPICRPLAQWVAPRAQLLWVLVEGDAPPPPGVSEADVPRTRAFFAPGAAAEFRARVPLLGGGTAEASAGAGAGAGAPMPLPLQARFSLTNGAVAAAMPEAPAGPGGGAAEQPQTADAASGHRLRVVVAAVLAKASSQVRGMWR